MDMQTQASENSEMRYYAFISYSRKDESWAKWLQKKLETYRLPSRLGKDHIGLPKRIFPVFRDMTDLSGTMVEQGLRPALKESRYLIVICSPNSAASQWVDNEVRWFIEMGRQEYIIPFVVDGVPFSSEQECFTPAMRSITPELLGVSISELGKQGAFLRVVATMLHLRYDEVVNRDRKRRMRNKAIGIVLAMLMAAVCVWVIWYNTEHSKYYSAYATRYEIPEGIQEMDKEVRSHCNYSYRITTRRKKVVRMEIVNSAGTVKLPDFWFADGYPRTDYGYDNKGNLISIVNRDESGTILSQETLSYNLAQRQIALDCREGNNAVSVRTFSTNLLGELRSDGFRQGGAAITRVLKTYDDQGFVTEVHYQRDNLGTPACDSEGIYGRRYTHDNRGLITGISDFDQTGNVLAISEWDYNAAGRVIEVRALDKYGKLVQTSANIAIQRIQYDAYSNTAQVDYLDSNGKSDICANNYSAVTLSYDVHGFLIQASFWDEYGYPMSDKTGIHKISYESDENGRVKKASYWGDDDLQTFESVGGTAGQKYTYDSRGRLTEILYFDDKGDPCYSRTTGSFGEGRAYDSNGYLKERRYLGEAGDLMMTREGYAYICHTNDASGRVLSEAYYDSSGKLTEIQDGYAAVNYSYDLFGNVSSVRYLNCDMEPCCAASGFAEIRRIYENGLLISESYFDLTGAPTSGTDNFFEQYFLYDEFGNQVRREYRSQTGELINLNGEPYAAEEYSYDHEGNITLTRYLDTELNPCGDKYGVGEIQSEYAGGDLISNTYFAKDGKRGYKIDYAYNDRHELISVAYYGAENQPMLSSDNYFKMLYEYDVRGNIAQELYLGVNGKGIKCSLGFSTAVYTYDNRGNRISECYFDIEGKPTCSREGYYKIQRTYDDEWNLVSTQQWRLVPGMNLKEEKTLDSHSRAISVKYYSLDETPVINSSGYHEKRNSYDSTNGHLLSESYYDTLGQSICCKDGYHEIQCQYDGQGREISYTYYGMNCAPILNASGYFEKRFTYFDNGRLQVVSYFGIDGEPVAVSWGYYQVRIFLNDEGRTTELQYLGEQESLLQLGPNITNICRVSYRSDLNQTTYQNFNRSPDGTEAYLYGFCYTYDENGNELSKISVDEYGNPIPK